MGQKISAYALRLGINQPWQSNYFPPKKEQANLLQQDKLIRNYLFTRFPEITQIKIERTEAELIIFAYSLNVSLITGENNDDSGIILAEIAKIIKDEKIITKLYLEAENKIYPSAQAIANDLAQQIQSRVACNLVLRNVLIKLGGEVKGFYILLEGRLDGAENSRPKIVKKGNMPSNSLAKLVEETKSEANTAYGKIGITVKIYREKGEKNKLWQS